MEQVRLCPKCIENGFESPSMKDHDLCGDCHDILECESSERDYYYSLQDC